MKRETLLKTAMIAAFVGFIFCLGAQAARAQNVQPFVDCVERERDNSGALTGKFVAHFGYINYGTTTSYIPVNTAGNILNPVRNPPNQPENFLPGVHPRILSVTIDPANTISETWFLSTYSTTALTNSQLCGSDSQNTRLMTYQGKLSDGATAANGVYDLRFQLFNAATGGTARTTQIAVEDVAAANGVFTVQLNLGANAAINPTGRAQALNAAILEGENGFFEIGVRPGNSTGAFTVLTPRQPLTAVPLAMRADTANNAVRAALADSADRLNNVPANQFVQTNDSRLSDARTPTAGSGNYIQNTTAPQANSNFNISGGGTIGGALSANSLSANSSSISGNSTIGGTLTANNSNISGNGTIGGNLTTVGTITSGCRSGFTAIAGGRLCVSAMQTAAAFYGAGGATQTCINLDARVGTIADATLSLGQSGFNYFSANIGWLGDYAGDNLRPTWNPNANGGDFDGAPVNVYTGGSSGTAPTYPYRCVY